VPIANSAVLVALCVQSIRFGFFFSFLFLFPSCRVSCFAASGVGLVNPFQLNPQVHFVLVAVAVGILAAVATVPALRFARDFFEINSSAVGVHAITNIQAAVYPLLVSNKAWRATVESSLHLKAPGPAAIINNFLVQLDFYFPLALCMMWLHPFCGDLVVRRNRESSRHVRSNVSGIQLSRALH
jgi:hypothetical protein